MEQTAFPDSVMLAAGRARGDVGIERAAAATERETPGWCDMACERLRQFVRGQAGLFTMELARFAFEKSIPRPRDLRSWGQVTRMARARGIIEVVPGRTFPAASSNGSPKPVYRRGGKA